MNMGTVPYLILIATKDIWSVEKLYCLNSTEKAIHCHHAISTIKILENPTYFIYRYYNFHHNLIDIIST